MSKIGIIIKREFLTRVKKRSFLIMTFLGPLLFLGFIAATFYISQAESKVYKVLLTDREAMFGKVLFKDEFKDSKFVKFYHQESPMTDDQFKASEYDIKIDLERDLTITSAVNLYYKTYPSFKIQDHIESQLTKNFQKLNLLKHDVTLELYDLLKTKISLHPIDIDKTGTTVVPTEVGYSVGLMLSVIIFMFIMMYGQQIMRGVMEEKSSRIVEVIVSSVKPFSLMMGKIIGVALVGLTQFIMWILLSSFLFFIAGMFLPDVFSDPSALMEQQMTPEMQNAITSELGANPNDMAKDIYSFIHQVNFPFIIGMFIFYFLGGYFLFGSLYAAIGAAVDSETDSQQFMIPIMLPLTLGYIIAIAGIENPESNVMYWGSIIPLTSPIVMMVKVGSMGMGFQPIDWSLIITSMVLLIGAFILSVWVASKIYRAGILFHGKKVGYKDLWKWLRHG